MLRIESFQIVRLRREEMLRDAERARFAARFSRRQGETSGRRFDLRLLARRPMTAFRQAF